MQQDQIIAAAVTAAVTLLALAACPDMSQFSVDPQICETPATCPGKDDACSSRVCLHQECGIAYATEETLCGADDGGRCNGAGICRDGVGATCVDNDECLSGSCVEGVCCESACDGECAACSALGACDPVDIGTPCEGGVCDGAGATCAVGVVDWGRQFGTSGAQHGSSVAMDPDGAVFAAGTFFGGVSFGGATLVGAPQNSYLVKLSHSGEHIWSLALGKSGQHFGPTLAAKPGGGVIVAGDYAGEAQLESGIHPSGSNTSANDDRSVFVASVDAYGQGDWFKLVGDDNAAVQSVQRAGAMALDDAGNILVAGDFTGTMSLGNIGSMSTAPNDVDVFIAVLDPAGKATWSKSYGHPGAQIATGIAASPDGNIAIVGEFSDELNFGSAGDVLASGSGAPDVFVALLDGSGSHVWSVRYGDDAYQTATAVTSDPQGNIIVAGSFAGEMVLREGGVEFELKLTGTEGRDAYLVKIDPSGVPSWAKSFGGPGDQLVHDVVCDQSGNIVLVGSFEGSIDFGDGPRTAAGGSDVFIAKLSPGGVTLWDGQHGDSGNQVAAAVASGPGQQLAITGHFASVIAFGEDQLSSWSGDDIFVAQFSP